VTLQLPCAQVVGPDHPCPPHCPYNGAPLPEPDPCVGVGVAVAVTNVVGVGLLPPPPPPPPPEQVMTAGPGIWYGRPPLVGLPLRS